MVIRELLKNADKVLFKKGIADSYNEATVLFGYAADKSKTYIFTHMDDEIDGTIEKRFFDYIEKRSCNMPVAYITGSAWFMSLEFSVDESTLIPRPETEELVEEVLENIKKLPGEKIDILDMCTGSGCIGIAIAHNVKRVYAVLADVNPNCIKIAKTNANRHNLTDRISFYESDLYNSIPVRKFDVITSNPPYIPSSDVNGLEPDVKDFEPITALDGGADGLDFYRKITEGAGNYLKPGGHLVFESGINLSVSIKSILIENDFSDIEIKNDISGIPRIISAVYDSLS